MYTAGLYLVEISGPRVRNRKYWFRIMKTYLLTNYGPDKI